MAERLPSKVLHVMNGAAGGAALSTLGLMSELQAKGVRSCVVCDDAGAPEEREALREATQGEVAFTPLYWWNRKIRSKAWKRPAIEIRQWVRTGLRVAEVAQVVRAARRWGAELVHTNTFLTPVGGYVARILGVGHVWHLRELIGAGQPFQLPLGGERLGKFLLANSSVVVANSHTSAQPLRKFVPADHLTVVPNGIDLEAFAHVGRRSEARVTVGMVANLTSRTKKHHLFIEAARLAPGAEYRLYGHAPPEGRDGYADQVRRLAAAAGVRLMGFVDAPIVMANLDVLVHTADTESFGRTVVEAMAASRPVVGVAGGGVGETVLHGATGFLATPDSPHQLAAHLRRLIAEPELRHRLGMAGRARALEEYSLRACGDRVAEVYKRAVAAPVGSGATMLSLLKVWS